MELRTALWISGTAHGALVVWALAAGWLSSELRDPFEATEVTLITGADFAVLVEQAGGGVPQVGETVEPAEEAPEPEVAEPVTPEPEEPAPAPEVAEPVEAPEPDVAEPETADPTPPEEPETDVAETPSPEVPAESPATELAEEPGDVPDPAPVVAPQPVQRTEEDVAEAPEVVEATEPTQTEEQPVEAETEAPAAPRDSTTRIVTEATETGGAEQVALAPGASIRPRVRPARPAPETEPQEVAETPEAPAASDSDSADPIDAAIAAAAAEAATGGGADAADPGPPMTAGERDALRVAIQQCWVVDVGSQAANVTVSIGVSMTPEGRVRDSEVRMLSASGGDDSAVRAAFNAARRAVLRCQREGYDLPAEKYAQWQEIEMVFNPTDMRVR
ncbi:MAG: cell envelope biogenesis protein TolA [Pseudomonadota bacterium]